MVSPLSRLLGQFRGPWPGRRLATSAARQPAVTASRTSSSGLSCAGVDVGHVVPDVAAGLGAQGLVVAADLGAEQGRQGGVADRGCRRPSGPPDPCPARRRPGCVTSGRLALRRRCRRAAWRRRAGPRWRRGSSRWRRGRAPARWPLRISASTSLEGLHGPGLDRRSPAGARCRTGPGPAALTPPSGSAKAASATALSNSSALVSVPSVRSLRVGAALRRHRLEGLRAVLDRLAGGLGGGGVGEDDLLDRAPLRACRSVPCSAS